MTYSHHYKQGNILENIISFI